MTDKQQPEALRQAAWLKREGASCQRHYDLGVLIERQHAELETLREKLKTYEDLGDAGSDVQLLRMGYAAARLEIESLRGKGWQPIETAPKDGTLILAAINIHCSDGTAAWQRHAIYFDAERLN